jgi:hypothetical protein
LSFSNRPWVPWKILFAFLNPKAQQNIKKRKKWQQQNTQRAGCQWLMPVSLATQEAEIRRIMS